jgi:hypothetical protein
MAAPSGVEYLRSRAGHSRALQRPAKPRHHPGPRAGTARHPKTPEGALTPSETARLQELIQLEQALNSRVQRFADSDAVLTLLDQLSVRTDAKLGPRGAVGPAQPTRRPRRRPDLSPHPRRSPGADHHHRRHRAPAPHHPRGAGGTQRRHHCLSPSSRRPKSQDPLPAAQQLYAG